MSLSEAFIRVTCDRCGTHEDIKLWSNKGEAWDKRCVLKWVRNLKWKIDGEKHYCPQCVDESSPYYKYRVGT